MSDASLSSKQRDYAGRLRGWIGHPACPAQSVQDDLRAGADEIERLKRELWVIAECIFQNVSSDDAKHWARGIKVSLQSGDAAPRITVETTDQRLARALHVIDEAGKLSDWINRARPVITELMAAYERRIRSDCNGPEQLAKEPWRCAEYICAERLLADQPKAVVEIRPEEPRETNGFRCKANRTADPPQDCDWPNCGCDENATKVIESLVEQGWMPVPRSASMPDRERPQESPSKSKVDYIEELASYCGFVPRFALYGLVRSRELEALLEHLANAQDDVLRLHHAYVDLKYPQTARSPEEPDGPPLYRHDWETLPGGSYRCKRCKTTCLDAHDALLCAVRPDKALEVATVRAFGTTIDPDKASGEYCGNWPCRLPRYHLGP